METWMTMPNMAAANRKIPDIAEIEDRVEKAGWGNSFMLTSQAAFSTPSSPAWLPSSWAASRSMATCRGT